MADSERWQVKYGCFIKGEPDADLIKLLDDGWEPFAVACWPRSAAIVWLRKLGRRPTKWTGKTKETEETQEEEGAKVTTSSAQTTTS